MYRTYATLKPRFHIIQLTGRLAQDAVYRTLPASDGRHVTELRLAVNGMGGSDRDAVGYIDVVSYTMTEKAAQTIGKGWLVAVAGRIEHQTWEKDGRSAASTASPPAASSSSPPRATATASRTSPSSSPTKTTSLSRRRLAYRGAPPGRLRPGGRLPRPALRLRPSGQPPRQALQRRYALPGRRGPPRPARRVRRRPRHHIRLLRLPALPTRHDDPSLPMSARSDQQQYIVEADYRCQAQPVGHSGCSYASPPPVR